MKKKNFFRKTFLILLLGMGYVLGNENGTSLLAQAESDLKTQETSAPNSFPVPSSAFISSPDSTSVPLPSTDPIPDSDSSDSDSSARSNWKKHGLVWENHALPGSFSVKHVLLKNSASDENRGDETNVQTEPILKTGTDLESKSHEGSSSNSVLQSKPSETSWIFIPTDSQGQPVGDEYYFPLNLLHRHVQTSQTSTDVQQHGFFFRQALYTGSLVQNLASRDINIDSVHASFEVEVRVPETKVTFPFSPSQVYLVPGSALLNGKTFQVLWENGRPVVQFPKAGRYQLDFTLIPIVVPMEALFIPASSDSRKSEDSSVKSALESELAEKLGLSTDALSPSGFPDSTDETSSASAVFSRSGFRFEIPPIPSARLELQVPSNINSLEFPKALGSQEFEQNSRTWTVRLGAISHLAVQWKTPVSRTPAPSFLTAEELYSWHLKPDCQQIECRTRFHSTEEAFSRMEWVVDAGLDFDSRKVQLYIQRENPDSLFSENSGKLPDVTVGTTSFHQPSYVFVPYAGEKTIQTRMEGKKRHIILTLAQPVNEPVLAVFLLETPNSGNVGTYSLPLIRTEKTKVTHRWFHVIPEPNFQLELFQEQNIPQISVQEFLSVWEELCPFTGTHSGLARESMLDAGSMGYLNSMVSPSFPMTDAASTFPEIHNSEAVLSSVSSFVLDDSQGQSQSQIWKVKSEPLTEISTIQEKLFCAFDKDLVTVHLLVRFSDVNAIPSLFHVHIPENLTVQKVILHDGIQQKNLRFSYTKIRQIGIFYDKNPETTEPSSISGSNFNSISPTVPLGSGEFPPSPMVELPASSLPESIPSPLSKRPANFPLPPALCMIEIMGTMDLLDFSPKKEIQIPFPNLYVSEASLHSIGRVVNLYRSSRVLVSSPLPAGAHELEEREARSPIERHFAFENWRLVSAFSITPQEELNSNVQIKTNQPRILLNSRTFLKIPRNLVESEPDGSLRFSNPAQPENRNLLTDVQVNQADEMVQAGETRPEEILPTNSSRQTKNSTLSSDFSVESQGNFQLDPQTRNPDESAKKVEDFQEGSSLYSSNSHWQMTMEMILTVEKGLVDEIVLEMPASISQPYILEPPMPFELEPISNREVVRNTVLQEKIQKTGTKKGSPKTSKAKNALVESVKSEPEAETESGRETTELSSSASPEGAWVRMIIHPLKPVSGNIAIRFTADIQETSLENSVQNSLVRLSNLRFPGITVQKQDVLLPALQSFGHKNQFRWLTDGMIPLTASRLTVPGSQETNRSNETAHVTESNPNGSATPDSASASSEVTDSKPNFENPFTLTWKTSASSKSGNENLFRIYRVIEEHCFAQLQIQSFDWLNPTVNQTIHSIFWNSSKEFLGVTTLDILPQKAQTCILRIPRKMELLELHLDSRPVQIEEVVWNPSREEFQPASGMEQPENSEYQCFRVTLRSLQLPQHLEILYHGKASDWQMFRLPGSTALLRGNEHLYQLDLPVLLQQLQNETVPIEALSGATFFFVPTDSMLKLWSIKYVNGTGGNRSQRLSPINSRPWARVQLVCMEHLRDLIARVNSPRFAGSTLLTERTNWLQNWHLYWCGVVQLMEKTLVSRPEFDSPEIRQNFAQIQTGTQRLFTEILPEKTQADEQFTHDFSSFRQNSLWLVFIRNLPKDLKQMTAFETGNSSHFYMMETRQSDFAFPVNLWAVIYTLLFTLMISLGLYFNPNIPEEVRSTPFWLVCGGSLWLFCGLNVWIGLLLLTLSIVTLAYRIRKLQKRNS